MSDDTQVTVRQLTDSTVASAGLCRPGFVHSRTRGAKIETRPQTLSLKYVLTGEEIYETDTRRLVLRPGDMGLISGYQDVTFLSPTNRENRGLSIFLPLSELNAPPSTSPFAVRITGTSDRLCRHMQTAQAVERNNRKQAKRVMLAIRDEVQSIVASLFDITTSISNASHAALNTATRLLAAKRFIEAPDGWNQSVSAIASKFGFSRCHFARQFQTAFCKSPREARDRSRLQCAAGLVTATDLPLAEIALFSGYVDYPTFSKAFGRFHAITPSALRHSAQTDMD